jgi:hypothetical protein
LPYISYATYCLHDSFLPRFLPELYRIDVMPIHLYHLGPLSELGCWFCGGRKRAATHA